VRAPLKTWIAKVLEDLGPRVYLTINLDGFDSSIVPSTVAPEPGGLDWHQVTSLVRAVADHKKSSRWMWPNSRRDRATTPRTSWPPSSFTNASGIYFASLDERRCNHVEYRRVDCGSAASDDAT